MYDRYGSLDHAEEAFSQVLRMEPKFEKANEIYFRLGIIYKQQQKYDQSLQVSGERKGDMNMREKTCDIYLYRLLLLLLLITTINININIISVSNIFFIIHQDH